jgi:ParB/RepB/Spo0J family partition protein
MAASNVVPKEEVTPFPHERDEDGALLLNPNRVKPFSENPRKVFRRVNELAHSIKICGQQQPGKVRLIVGDKNYDAELVDGERRLRACKIAGVKFRAYPESGIANTDDQFERSFIANFGKEDHDCLEIAHSIKRLMDKKNRSLQEIADMAGKSITWAYQHLNLLGLHPKVQEMLVADEDQESARISFSLAQNLVKLPQDMQVRTANDIVKGKMNQVRARRHVLQIGRTSGKLIVSGRKGLNKSFASLMRMSENLSDSLGIYLDMSDKELTELFGVAPESAKAMLRERLVKFAEDLCQFIDVVEKKSKRKE